MHLYILFLLNLCLYLRYRLYNVKLIDYYYYILLYFYNFDRLIEFSLLDFLIKYFLFVGIRKLRWSLFGNNYYFVKDFAQLKECFDYYLTKIFFIINCYIKENCIFIICSDNISIINIKTMKPCHL